MKYELLEERKAVDKLIDVVTNSYTSRGNCNVLFHAERGTGDLVVTKDGKNSVEELRYCRSLVQTSVFRKAHLVGTITEKESGDGTSTAILAFLKAFECGLMSGIDITPEDISRFRSIFINYFVDKSIPILSASGDRFSNIKKFINTSCGSSLSNTELDIFTNEVIRGLESYVLPHLVESHIKTAEENISLDQKHGITFCVRISPIFHDPSNKNLDYCRYSVCTYINIDVLDYAKSYMENLWNDAKINASSRLFIFYQETDEEVAYLLRDRNKYIQLGYSSILPIQISNTSPADFADIADALCSKYALVSLDEVREVFRIIKNIDNIGFDLTFFREYNQYLIKYAELDESKIDFDVTYESVRFISPDEKDVKPVAKRKVKNDTQNVVKQDKPNAVTELQKAMQTKIAKTERTNKVISLLSLLDDIRTIPSKYPNIEARNVARNQAVLVAVPRLLSILQDIKRIDYVGVTESAQFTQGFNVLTLGLSSRNIKCDKNYLDLKIKESNERFNKAEDARSRMTAGVLCSIYSSKAINVIKCYGRDIYDSLDDALTAINLIISKTVTDKAFIDGSFREIRRFIKYYENSISDNKCSVFITVLKQLSSIFASKFMDSGSKINPGSEHFCSCLSENCQGCTLDSLLAVIQMLDAMCEGIKFSKSLIIDISKF